MHPASLVEVSPYIAASVAGTASVMLLAFRVDLRRRDATLQTPESKRLQLVRNVHSNLHADREESEVERLSRELAEERANNVKRA